MGIGPTMPGIDTGGVWGYPATIDATYDPSTHAISVSGSGLVVDVGPPSGFDDTLAIANAISACPAGGVVAFRPGAYFSSPIVIAKPISLTGPGGWSTQLSPTTPISGNFIQFNIPLSGTWQVYGPRVTGFGLNLYSSPLCTGLRFESNANWVLLRDFVITGGGVGISNAGTNNRFSQCNLFDCGIFIHVDADTGLELHLEDIQMGRNTAGTTTRCIEVIAATFSNNKGALYMTKVLASSGTFGGVQTNAGLYMYAPPPPNNGTFPCSMPLFANGCVFDDITGGGPGLEFENVADIGFADGWVNTGAASGGAAVKIGGCTDLKFRGNSFFGGGAGGTFRTYEFVDGTGSGTYQTRGVISKDNYCPTNWVYYFPTVVHPPLDLILDDYVLGATAGFAVSNNMTQMTTSRMFRFGGRYDSDKTTLRQPLLEDTVACGFATLVSGQVTINTPNADAAASMPIAFYWGTVSLGGGNFGVLKNSTITTGTSFNIQSLTPTGAVNTTDNSEIFWVLVNRG